MSESSEIPARALRDALRRLIVAHGTLNDSKRPCGAPLSTPHAWALLELYSSGPMTVSGLAGRLNIDRSNVSRLCTRMERNGEVEQLEHPQDGRARLISLTPKGQKIAAAVDLSSSEHFTRIIGRLDADLDQALHLLNSLTRSIRSPRVEDEDIEGSKSRLGASQKQRNFKKARMKASGAETHPAEAADIEQ